MLTRELTAIDRGDRRDDGTHGTSVPAIRRGFSASFSRTRGDARSLRAVGLEDTSRGQKKRGFPRVRTEEDGTLLFPRKSMERGRERQGTTWDRFHKEASSTCVGISRVRPNHRRKHGRIPPFLRFPTPSEGTAHQMTHPLKRSHHSNPLAAISPPPAAGPPNDPPPQTVVSF